jgi:hypothetical protein
MIPDDFWRLFGRGCGKKNQTPVIQPTASHFTYLFHFVIEMLRLSNKKNTLLQSYYSSVISDCTINVDRAGTYMLKFVLKVYPEKHTLLSS